MEQPTQRPYAGESPTVLPNGNMGEGDRDELEVEGGEPHQDLDISRDLSKVMEESGTSVADAVGDQHAGPQPLVEVPAETSANVDSDSDFDSTLPGLSAADWEHLQ